jgi:(R,R)-butanediol dehydrogenase/meso-butanediol dehydrogenase/diacetyl reductase
VHEYLAGPIFPPPEGTRNPNTGVTLPVVLGHEFAGTIVEVGSSVRDLSVGQTVVVNPACDHRHYGTEPCSPCKDKQYNICDGTTTYGLSAPGGGFSDEIVVKALNCLVLPSGVSLKAGALVEPLSVAQHCITHSGFKKGQTALICGAGPIGLALLLLLRVKGASKVIVTEVLETRTAYAKRFGANAVINPLQRVEGDPNPALTAIRRLVVDGVDVAFDATGLQSTLDLSIASVKPRGVIFNVAIHEKPLSLDLNALVKKEKTLKAGICYLHEDFEAVIKMLAGGTLDAEQLVTSVVPLSNAIKGGFEELINNRDAHVKILIQPD